MNRKLTEEHKKKISIAHMGKKRGRFSKNWREKISSGIKNFHLKHPDVGVSMGNKKRGKNNGNWRGGKITIYCGNCGKKLLRWPKKLRNKKGNFCDMNCVNEWKSKYYLGKNGTNWKGGITSIVRLARNNKKYSRWRTKVFTRDNWTCQNCFKRGVPLEAHHIKRVAKFLGLIYDVENGLTLCKECHRKINKFE